MGTGCSNAAAHSSSATARTDDGTVSAERIVIAIMPAARPRGLFAQYGGDPVLSPALGTRRSLEVEDGVDAGGLERLTGRSSPTDANSCSRCPAISRGSAVAGAFMTQSSMKASFGIIARSAHRTSRLTGLSSGLRDDRCGPDLRRCGRLRSRAARGPDLRRPHAGADLSADPTRLIGDRAALRAGGGSGAGGRSQALTALGSDWNTDPAPPWASANASPTSPGQCSRPTGFRSHSHPRL